MPYEWTTAITQAPPVDHPPSFSAGDAPVAELHAWPFRSLPRRGFVGIIGMAFLLLMIPLFPLIGSVLLWGILPFALTALAGLWFFIEKSYKDGEILEELEIWPDHIRLTRTGPKRRRQVWEANPYWVSLEIHPTGGPVANYLTLKGAGRTVELGAFLDETERPTLHDALTRALILAKSRQ
ncbi:DUF2244 domain-containing protein [Aliiroseovarius subalbicans]|uniref:DUF2244 domain-containing protein n=1 Tax=Aliiroseovarius subalbicans TaxID=2925840 RepID=UPI001F57CE7D|nr:DUF2244 domain-containing protein [Aliiroseovarius subalbicans]MCI2399301.1 DUF2244 domain-containing protein [Aliiroseovarius subalbicans]